MKQHFTLAGLAVVALGACSDNRDGTGPMPEPNPTGAVYVQTNAAAGNEVIAFRRA